MTWIPHMIWLHQMTCERYGPPPERAQTLLTRIGWCCALCVADGDSVMNKNGPPESGEGTSFSPPR